jgi:hypothetical protein
MGVAVRRTSIFTSIALHVDIYYILSIFIGEAKYIITTLRNLIEVPPKWLSIFRAYKSNGKTNRMSAVTLLSIGGIV